MLGLSFDKLLIIAIFAGMLLGPEHLPRLISRLTAFMRTLREIVRATQERVRDEVGPEFDEIDWAKLDPRQYDPRRIVRDALGPEQEHER
jgi:sec-independent protein translocase protein TatB